MKSYLIENGLKQSGDRIIVVWAIVAATLLCLAAAGLVVAMLIVLKQSRPQVMMVERACECYQSLASPAIAPATPPTPTSTASVRSKKKPRGVKTTSVQPESPPAAVNEEVHEPIVIDKQPVESAHWQREKVRPSGPLSSESAESLLQSMRPPDS